MGDRKAMEDEVAAREERRRQAELRAAAAERRMREASSTPSQTRESPTQQEQNPTGRGSGGAWEPVNEEARSGLLALLFGKASPISKAVVSQWTSQGLL